jgi:hypothetical protein
MLLQLVRFANPAELFPRGHLHGLSILEGVRRIDNQATAFIDTRQDFQLSAKITAQLDFL